MSKAEKVTVSLPAELLARIDERHRQDERSRSAVVADLLWLGWHQVEAEERERRYRAAYLNRPETEDERAWADAAAADLLGDPRAEWGPEDGHHGAAG
ncbi:MAG: ribbon-helix-helix protein, CopG family [Acidimicrobiales bacterium]